MGNKFNNEIRQSSVIFTAGPGALTVLQDGSTVILSGTDTWYWNQKAGTQLIPLSARVTDRRLAGSLGVSGFVQPPAEGVSEEPDTDHLLVSLFPTWVTCFACDSLLQLQKNDPQIPYCQNCLSSKNNKRKMVQVNFIIACENGHLDEFPWVEWVHRGKACLQQGSKLKLTSRGAVELSAQKVACSCGKKRTLAGTTEFGVLAKLAGSEGPEFTCAGNMPWLRKHENTCLSEVRMAQRNANNVYFSSTESAILVPDTAADTNLIVDKMQHSNKRQTYFGLLMSVGWNFDEAAGIIKALENIYYSSFTKEEISEGLKVIEPPVEELGGDEIEEVSIYDRQPEWDALTAEREHNDLVVRETAKLGETRPGLNKYLAIPKLRRTVALSGFSRLILNPPSIARGRSLLRRNPFTDGADWLPAVQHTGEGIVISFDEKVIAAWEHNPYLLKRVDAINDRLISADRTIPHSQMISPRFVLLHTFAHLLIQELVIASGYTSASLAERIYADSNSPGILIYTAASDGDGTMGGLVELARPETLNPSIERALEHAQWCSSDPICMETGSRGQGNYGGNGAACHNCTLLPETACDYMNMALDRALLIGDSTNEFGSYGYFNS